jgi:hypothetical protein
MIARRLPRTPTRDQLQPVRNYPQLKAIMAAALVGRRLGRMFTHRQRRGLTAASGATQDRANEAADIGPGVCRVWAAADIWRASTAVRT